MGFSKKLFGNPIISSFGVRGTAIALKSVQLILLVRLYGPDLFGAYSIALGVFGLTMVFAQLGLEHFVQREASNRKQTSYSHLIKIGQFLAVPGLVFAAISLLIIWTFYNQAVTSVYAILVIAAPIYAVCWNQTFVLRGSGQVNLSLFLFEIVNPVSMIITAFVFRESDLGLPLAFLSTSTLTLFLTTYFVRDLHPKKEVSSGTENSIKSSIFEARSLYATSVLQALQSLADGLAVGFFLRPVDAALYAIITRMAGLVLMPIAILSIYMKNSVAKLRGQPLGRIWLHMRRFTFASIVLSISLWAVLIVLAPFIGIIFDTNFPPEAMLTYVLVVTCRALQGSAEPLNSLLFMSGREAYLTRIHTLLLPPYLVALVLLAPLKGLLGVGLTLLAYTVMLVAASIFVLVSNFKS